MSLYPQLQFDLELYYTLDRGCDIFGAKMGAQKALGAEFYAGARMQYSKSERIDPWSERGVKISKNALASSQNADPSTIVMPSIKNTYYLDEALKAGVEIKKVFNYDAYFFTFPLSLRREALSGGYTHYTLHQYAVSERANEYRLALLLDTLWLNLFAVPLSLEYRYNDNERIAQRNNFRLFAGFSF